MIFPLIILNLFFYTAYQKNISEIRNLNQKISELEKENQELKDTPLLGWKEYVDGKYKFKVWYPEEAIGYKIIAKEDEKIFPDISGRYFEFNNPNGINDWGIPQLLLQIRIYEQNTLRIDEFIRENLKNEINFSDENIIIEKNNNIDLYKVEIPDEVLSYYVKKDNLIFVFNMSAGEFFDQKEEVKKIFEQMVRSFRFIK